MKRYAKDQDEMALILAISARQFRNIFSNPDAPQKTKSGHNIKKCQEYYKKWKERGLQGDGSLRDEKLLREISKLDIHIKQLDGDLVDRRETEKEYRAKLARYRGIADAWKSHNTAKYPEHKNLIEQLWADLCEQMELDTDDPEKN